MKYILTILIVVVLLCNNANSFGQKIITGQVLNALSKQPLDAAQVSITMPNNSQTITDENGKFVLPYHNSTTTISISHIGYQSYTGVINPNEKAVITLQPATLKLEDVTITANTTAKFSTLSKIDLAVNPVKNAQELLRIVPGLFIAQHAGGGKAEQLFLRGFDVDHGTDVQVSIDGMPINMVSHAHGQGYADAHFIIPETVHNIDFGTGPYYAQQGNFNTAGYVNFATYKNITRNTIQQEVGRFNTYRTVAMLDLLKGDKAKQSAYIAGEYNYTNGPKESKQKFNRVNLFTKYNAAITNNTQLSFSVSAFKSKWNASGQIPNRAVTDGLITRFGSIDDTEGGNTERYNANIILNHQLQNGAVWQNQAYFSRYIFNLYSNFTFFLNDTVNGDQINQQEARNIFGIQSTLRKKFFFKNWTLQSNTGVGIRTDATEDSRLANTVKRNFLSNVKLGDIKEANLFAFTQQQAQLGKWTIEAGARVDYFKFHYLDRLDFDNQLPKQQKAIVSPKLNIQYTVNKKIQLYIKAGKGFHSNDARVVIANEGKQILPAAFGTDFGVFFKPTKNLLINVAVWDLYLQQEFVYVGDAGIVEPSGRTKRQGVDIIARYQIAKNWYANTNISITKPRARDEQKGMDYIPLAPTVTSNGGVYYKKQLGLNGGVNYRYIKDRPANEDNSVIAKGYFLIDATLNYTKPKFEIGFAIENVLNVKWNEAQFNTESRLRNEPNAVSELHYTPGTPFFGRVKVALFF